MIYHYRIKAIDVFKYSTDFYELIYWMNEVSEKNDDVFLDDMNER